MDDKLFVGKENIIVSRSKTCKGLGVILKRIAAQGPWHCRKCFNYPDWCLLGWIIAASRKDYILTTCQQEARHGPIRSYQQMAVIARKGSGHWPLEIIRNHASLQLWLLSRKCSGHARATISRPVGGLIPCLRETCSRSALHNISGSGVPITADLVERKLTV